MKTRSFTAAAILLGTLSAFTACNIGPKAGKNTEIAMEYLNPTLQTIAERRSVRSYTATPVSADTIDVLLRAAMSAPTAMDRRPWHFVVVTDRAALDTLAAALPYAKMLPQTAQAVVVCGDSSVSQSWMVDCSAATQNFLLAAQSLGLGAVWTGASDGERAEAVRRVLGLPDDILPLNVIPFGYSHDMGQAKDKYDSARIHFNGWGAK